MTDRNNTFPQVLAVLICHSARQNRPRIGAQNRPPCGGYWTKESSCSDLVARGGVQFVTT